MRSKLGSFLRWLDSPNAPLWYFTIMVAGLFVGIILRGGTP